MNLHFPTSRLTAALTCAAILVVIAVLSCSREPKAFILRNLYGPPGKSTTYKLTSHRVGTVMVDNNPAEALDSKMDGTIIYTAIDTLPGGAGIVKEDDLWGWDEKSADSGKTVHQTKNYGYTLKYAANGKVLDFQIIGGSTAGWTSYAGSFYEQGTPIFPDQPISIGYSWTQTIPVILTNGKTDTATTVYRVKGLAQKMGYNCAIIEYRGNLILPIMLDPTDTVATQGIDRIEMNGLLYFAIKEGMAVSSDERRRLNSRRSSIKAGKLVNRKTEAEDDISYSLENMTGK